MAKVSAEIASAIAAAGNVLVQHLPAGKAYGADDLSTWAQRRLVGRDGVLRKMPFLVRCKTCHLETEMQMAPNKSIVLKCRRCGSHKLVVKKRKRK